MGSIFKRGYSASRKEIAKQEERRANMGNQLFRFFIKAGKNGKENEAPVVFLTEEPVNFDEHTIKQGDKFVAYTCVGSGCPLCAEGDRPTAKGAYLIIDQRHFEYEDKNGNKKEGDEALRLFVQGMKVVSQLDRISNRRGLCNKDMTVVRMGSGTSTNYTFEDGDENKVSKKHIEGLMPEKMREEWDGTQEGLMDIIEEQLMMCVPNGVNDEDEEAEVDDYEEDDEEIADEPKHRTSRGKSSHFGGKKKKKSTFKKKQGDGFVDIDDDEDNVDFQ